MVKISTFIAGMVLASLFVALFGLFMGSINTYYSVSDYNSSRVETYNKLDNLALEAEAIQNQTLAVKEKSGLLDVLGAFFNEGYRALRVSYNSFDVFRSVAYDATEDVNLGPSGALIRTALVTIVIILLVIGVLISAIVKKDL